MHRFGILLCLVASLVAADPPEGKSTCQTDVTKLFTGIDFIDFKDECQKATEKQIKMEVSAAMKYLSMGAYFSRDNVNRPGFAKLFIDAASEEREHATKLIEYLAMRSRYLNEKDGKSSTYQPDLSKLVKEAENPEVLKAAELANLGESNSGLTALQNALKMEVAVTKSIRELIITCEADDSFNHYHFVDYLTGEFLEEQYHGQRDLAGKISTLGKMVQGNGAELGEFLFDKQLL